MAVNVLQLRISYNKMFFDDHCLFACQDTMDVCCRMAEISCEMSDVIKTTKHWFQSMFIGDMNLLNAFKFEDVGKGLIKSHWNEPFIMTFNNSGKSYLICLSHLKTQHTKKVPGLINMDGYALSLFLHGLTHSQKYVELVTNFLSQKCYKLWKLMNEGVTIRLSDFQICLKEPESHVMDLTWAKMACITVYERRQLQYAMSWLSTLGGAFSALGEEQERCAKTAGMISIEQMRIALRLGDNIIIAQCKLYFSLSLIQRGYCRLAKKIIKEQYIAMKKSAVVDKKTVNMCKGIWARLKYEIYKNRMAREKSSL